jgi:hypothetical protein
MFFESCRLNKDVREKLNFLNLTRPAKLQELFKLISLQRNLFFFVFYFPKILILFNQYLFQICVEQMSHSKTIYFEINIGKMFDYYFTLQNNLSI